jgi:hypothetical protein
MPPTRPRLLVLVLLVLTPMPLVVQELTHRRCEREMARLLQRKMETGELAMPKGSDSSAAAARMMAFYALEDIMPTRDIVLSFGASVALLACTIGAFRMRCGGTGATVATGSL